MVTSFFSMSSLANDNAISNAIQNLLKLKSQNLLNEEKNIIHFNNLLFRDDKLYKKFSIEPFTGIGVKFHKNGQLKTSLKIENGKLITQEWKCFHDNGKLEQIIPKIEFEIKDESDIFLISQCLGWAIGFGKKSGIQKRFYENLVIHLFQYTF